MEVTYLSITLSIFFLLTVSVFTYILSKKINFPYTVLLLLVGILLIPLANNTVLFSFINHFKLTPELLFYVFLPILLFESAYNINYRELLKNWKSISLLAIVGLLISALIISLAMYFILPLVGFQIPFLVCLLFGSFISSTDPVAVLSIFKHLGAPKRLCLLFEGESLFNDGTSLSLFLVILGIILSGGIVTSSTIFDGIGMFLSMLFGGLIFGAFMGVSFSKIIGYVKNNELAEITLTMILAHLTFISAELISQYGVHISGIVATAIAGIIIGNYGKYKISPKVESHMSQFWELFAFLSNSLVFVLMGLILSHIEINFSNFIIPLILVIIIIMIARVISVFIPIKFVNFFKLEEHIPDSYTKLLSWGSLRGALSLIMVLMIPGVGDDGYEKMLAFQNSVGWNFDFSIKDFLMVITIGSIMFTLFIKATTIGLYMKKLGLAKMSKLEQFEYQEGKILTTLKMYQKIQSLYEKNYLVSGESSGLKEGYEEELKQSIKGLKELIKHLGKEEGRKLVKRALSLHALGIEKQYLKDLFAYNEISEKNFRFILDKISRQIERLESGKMQLRNDTYEKEQKDIFQKVYRFFIKDKKTFADDYMIYRAKAVITRKVIKEFKELSKVDLGFDNSIFEEVIILYKNFNKVANEKKDDIYKKHKYEISVIETKLVNKSLLKLEEDIVKDLYKKEIITPKLYVKFIEEIEEGILTDIQKIC